MPKGDPLVQDATEIAQLLSETSRRYVHRSKEMDERRSGLTLPQISTLTVLFDAGPLSLKDLSRELGLSHSTVSGIVDRLERQGLARRQTDTSDRRVTRISVTDQVDAYVRKGYGESQLGLLLPALRSATAKQRRAIRDGLRMLHSLISGEAD